jgi:hypothetical protein
MNYYIPSMYGIVLKTQSNVFNLTILPKIKDNQLVQVNLNRFKMRYNGQKVGCFFQQF